MTAGLSEKTQRDGHNSGISPEHLLLMGRFRLCAPLLIMLGLIVIFAYWVNQDRDQRLCRAAAENENIARSLEASIVAVVHKADISLLFVSAETGRIHTGSIRETLRIHEEKLWDNAYEPQGLLLIEADGYCAAGGPDSGWNHPSYHGDQAYFTRQRDNPSLGLFVSEPRMDSLSGWQIVISRRLNKQNGDFGGVALVTIPLAGFDDLFGLFKPGSHSDIFLLSRDLDVVASFTNDKRQRLKSIRGGLLDAAIRENPGHGGFRGKSVADDVDRVYHYRRVDDLPFIIVVGQATEHILAEWRDNAWLGGIALAVLLFAIVLLGRLLLTGFDRELESGRRLMEITSTLGEGVYVLDKNGLVTFVNPEMERLLGWTEAELLGRDGHAVFHYKKPDGPPLPAEDCQVHQSISAGLSYHVLDNWMVHRNGAIIPGSMVSSPIFRNGKITGSVIAFQDASSRQEREKALRESEERFRLLFDSTNDAIFVQRMETVLEPGRFMEVNRAASQILGYSRQELLTMTSGDLEDLDGAKDMPGVVDKLIATRHALFERTYLAKNGGRIPVEISTHAFMLQGQPALLSIVRDISERKKAEEEIRRLADFDTLTGLPNRRLLLDRLKQALFQARRYQRPLAVMFLDLDNFKQVNDTLGHDVGDELLKAVADRLVICVRGGDTVARLGGDEFVIVLAEITNIPAVELVAEKIIRSFKESLLINKHEIQISTSIGGAINPVNGGYDAQKLLKMADIAMYAAKAAGRDRFLVFQEPH